MRLSYTNRVDAAMQGMLSLLCQTTIFWSTRFSMHMDALHFNSYGIDGKLQGSVHMGDILEYIIFIIKQSIYQDSGH